MSKEEFKKQKYIKLFIDYINQKNYFFMILTKLRSKISVE